MSHLLSLTNATAHGSARDLHQAHRALHQTTQLLQTLVHASPLAIVSLDQEQRVLSWNKAAEQLFGWRESEVLGHMPPCVPEDAQGSSSGSSPT